MKTISNIFVLSIFLLLSSSIVFAEGNNMSILDALSEEAKDTSMDENVVPEELTVEPSIKPKAITDYSALEDKIAAQIKGVLVKTTKGAQNKDTKKDKEFHNKLENIVSSALLKGNKLNDIRNAVSAAMIDINSGAGEDISKGTISSANKALKSIVGNSKKDVYIESLKNELPNAAGDSSQKKAVVAITGTNEFESASTVTVLEGETLFKIAQRIYGSGAKYLALYEANKDRIDNPNIIHTGQVLKIPQ